MASGIKRIRWSSHLSILGIPLLDVAIGPDPENNEWAGRAKGVLAIGDLATGLIAIGKVSVGAVAIGGIACGLFCFGGLSLGAIAIGGISGGWAAAGGIAFGYYSTGGLAIGHYALDAITQSPEAEDFFRKFLPWIMFKDRGSLNWR